jgi:hypothetical protein
MEKHIEELNKRTFQSIDKTYPVGLIHGQMGISIYFYHLSRIEKDENYEAMAEQLLDDTLNKISSESSVSIESGLAGIALGIIHLIKSDFVEGDIDELLENIDNAIFKQLAFLPNNLSTLKNELLHLLFYFYIRLKDQKYDDNRYIFQELIIEVLNLFAVNLKEDFFKEYHTFSVYHYHLPMFVYICSKLLELDFYNDRIHKIVETFEPMILSRLPLLHANRLYLLCVTLSIIPYIDNPQWKEYATLLHKEISLNHIFEKEIKNKHIFISNGLSMIYILLNHLNHNFPEYKIDYSPQMFYDKIIASEAWTSFKQDYYFNIHQGLVNGFPGVQLVLSHIKKQNV